MSAGEINSPIKEKGETMEVQVYSDAVPKYSPWGAIDDKEKYAPGIWFVTTPSHGGIWLSPERRKEINRKSPFLGSAAWWEEDCDCVIPIVFFANSILSFSPGKAELVKTCRKYLEGRQK